MKILSSVLAVAVLGAVATFGEVTQQAQVSTLITTAGSTNVLPIKGIVKNIYFDVPTAKTGSLTVVSSEGYTILNVSAVDTDTLYAPRVQKRNTLGQSIATNDVDEIAVAGDVTVTINPAASTTGTNVFKVYINYVK